MILRNFCSIEGHTFQSTKHAQISNTQLIACKERTEFQVMVQCVPMELSLAKIGHNRWLQKGFLTKVQPLVDLSGNEGRSIAIQGLGSSNRR